MVLVFHEFDQERLKKTIARIKGLDKRAKNRVLKPAVKAGMTRLAREIRKGIPAYIPIRKSKAYETEKGKRRKGRLWEAKSFVGSKAKIAKGGPLKGGIEGKAGSGVGKKRARSRDRNKKRQGRKGAGIGAGNLHWYLAGTKPRYTRTKVYTGRMRKPRLVQRVHYQFGSIAVAVIDQRVIHGIKKEWIRSQLKR